ncbi:hypothetical protein KAR91_28455 [Candidatus Pacearchaeota archaeon]|nr:hypothetical protein [Candidatus Pacearchaeota archaeon]
MINLQLSPINELTPTTNKTVSVVGSVIKIGTKEYDLDALEIGRHDELQIKEKTGSDHNVSILFYICSENWHEHNVEQSDVVDEDEDAAIETKIFYKRASKEMRFPAVIEITKDGLVSLPEPETKTESSIVKKEKTD